MDFYGTFDTLMVLIIIGFGILTFAMMAWWEYTLWRMNKRIWEIVIMYEKICEESR